MTISKRLTKLKEHIFSERISGELTAELQRNTGKSNSFTVFLSVCNKKERAKVFHGSGKNIQAAWGNAEKRLDEYQKKLIAKKTPFITTWAKADVVTHYERIRTVDLNKIVVNSRWHNFARIGISFDDDFNKAFIEAEINGNKMLKYDYSQEDILMGRIDYDSVLINLDNVNHYLKAYYDMPPIMDVPEVITIFTAKCFFCDENEAVYELYSDNMDYGRRKIELVDNKVIHEIIVGASEYLVRLIDDKGKFIYGYFPIFGATMENYNILRHTSTLWSIINLYRISNDESLIPKLDKAIDYMVSFIDNRDDDTAYLVEREINEVKLGGSSVAIIMLTEYMDVFNTDKYIGMIKKLANGILELQNPETGKYYHVLNFPDYTKKEETRTVYYDGEATFALARTYSYTKDNKYLDGAKAAVENFIREDYIKYRDHWVAYSLLEVTKHVDDVRYYEFALKNIDKNLKGVYYRETSFHTYLEMLMTGWQTYKRALKDGIESDFIKKYDPTQFAQTVYHRARHMLNGYFYPEYAMYMKFPDTVAGSFCVRHHNFRVRIDDVQHFIGGYYFYTLFFDDIRALLSDEFLSSINEGNTYATAGCFGKFALPSAAGDNIPIDKSISNIQEKVGSYGDPELWAYSTLVPTGNEKLVKIYEIQGGISIERGGVHVNREITRQKMWLHDILDDSGIPYQIEISGDWATPKKYVETHSIYVEEKHEKKARLLIEEYNNTDSIVQEDMIEKNLVYNMKNGIPQVKCSSCGKEIDFDYIECPFCNAKRQIY